MFYINDKSAVKLGLYFSLMLTSATQASVPESPDVRPLNIVASDTVREWGKANPVPNVSAAKKALTTAGSNQNFESDTPKQGSFGRAWLSADYAVKVSTMPVYYKCTTPSGHVEIKEHPSPGDKYVVYTSPSKEARTLLNLRTSNQQKPVAGFTLCLVRQVFRPNSVDLWLNLGAEPYHIMVFPRVKPVANMESHVADSIAKGSASGLNVVQALGRSIGRMQANSIRKNAEHAYVADTHHDLNTNNVIITSYGNSVDSIQFTTIDNGDFCRGSDDGAKRLAVDVIYSLFWSSNVAALSSDYNGLSSNDKNARYTAYVTRFFEGYVGQFNADMQAKIQPIFTTLQALTDYEQDRMYAADFRASYNDVALPAIKAVFTNQKVPPFMGGHNNNNNNNKGNKYNNNFNNFNQDGGVHFKDTFMPQDQFAEQFGVRGMPRGFDVNVYIMYPDIEAFLRPFRSDAEKYRQACLHYKNHGADEGRLYALPKGFDANVYLEHDDLKSKAAALHSLERRKFAIVHYLQCGHQEGRLFCFPHDFDPFTYTYAHEDLRKDADKKGKNYISYGRWHYLMYGHKEHRPYTIAQQMIELKTEEDKLLATVPILFDSAAYLLHKDLKAAIVDKYFGAERERQAKLHYARYGQKEGRLYRLPAGFDGIEYLRANPDVYQAWQQQSMMTRDEFGRMHWINYGHKEKTRKLK